MIERRLRSELERVEERLRRLRLWQALAASWTLAALIGIGLLAAFWLAGVSYSQSAMLLGGAALLLAVAGTWYTQRIRHD